MVKLVLNYLGQLDLKFYYSIAFIAHPFVRWLASDWMHVIVG
jgi:hypothetical protein